MNKQLSRLLQSRPKRRKGDTQQLAAQLAPLEEQKTHEQTMGQRGAVQESGAIIVGYQGVRLSHDVVEHRASQRFLDMEPVVLFILGLMLAFIAFIAWQIWRMPPDFVEKMLSL